MTTCSCPMPIPVRTANGEPLVWRCANCNRLLPVPDPRFAEIERLRAALAAGPAALRRRYSKYEAGIVKSAYEDAAQVVEAAQKRAMLKQGGG